MRLTEAGRTFLKEARSILSQSQRAVQLAQAASRGEAGHLDIAYPVEGFEPVLLRVIRLFRRLFPVVELGIREMQYHQQIQKLIHQSDERDRLRKQADETFRGLPLLTKPLGEATAMKLVALLLAGLDAHAKSLLEQEGKLEPDKFLPMVSAYCLRDDNESSEFGEAAKDFVKKL